MDRVRIRDVIRETLAKTRSNANKSQKDMAKLMGYSISTIQNLEYGYKDISIIDFLEWCAVLNVNPSKEILKVMQPDVYDIADKEHKQLENYYSNVSSESEKEKIEYIILGDTGSSWKSQLEMITAYNHLPLIDRVNIADNICTMYELRKLKKELRNPNICKPNIEKIKEASDKCKESVVNGHESYFV